MEKGVPMWWEVKTTRDKSTGRLAAEVEMMDWPGSGATSPGDRHDTPATAAGPGCTWPIGWRK